jgi:hypothetical protein
MILNIQLIMLPHRERTEIRLKPKFDRLKVLSVIENHNNTPFAKIMTQIINENENSEIIEVPVKYTRKIKYDRPYLTNMDSDAHKFGGACKISLKNIQTIMDKLGHKIDDHIFNAFEQFNGSLLPIGRFKYDRVSYLMVSPEIRKFLISDLYYEIDIESCFYAIIRNLIRTLNINTRHTYLDLYLTYKDELIECFNNKYPDADQSLKQLLLGVLSRMYTLSIYETLLHDYNFELPMIRNHKLVDLFNGLLEEVNQFTLKYIEMYHDLIPYYIGGSHVFIERVAYTPEWAVISINDSCLLSKVHTTLLLRLCSSYESDIILCLHDYLISKKFTVGDYMCDGLLVEKNRFLDQDTLDHFCKMYKDKFDFELKLKFK